MACCGWFSRNVDLMAAGLLTVVFGVVSSAGGFVQREVSRAPMNAEQIRREAREAMRQAAQELESEIRTQRRTQRHTQPGELRQITDEIRREKDQFHREVQVEIQRGKCDLRNGLDEFRDDLRRGTQELRDGLRQFRNELRRETSDFGHEIRRDWQGVGRESRQLRIE